MPSSHAARPGGSPGIWQLQPLLASGPAPPVPVELLLPPVPMELLVGAVQVPPMHVLPIPQLTPSLASVHALVETAGAQTWHAFVGSTAPAG
jgi:hypothetical protein